MGALPARVSVTIEGQSVEVRAWRYLMRGVYGHEVPVYLLDTALPENSAWYQTLTDHLYGGDDLYRLCQEAILGIGGVAMLCALGHTEVGNYHMNEGHSALLVLALLGGRTTERGLRATTSADIEAVRRSCVFTTHTPVPAGHRRLSNIYMTAISPSGATIISYLRYAISIPLDEIQQAHALAKAELLAEVERCTGERLDPAAMTISFARRTTGCKRPDLLFSDQDRLRAIARMVGPFQVSSGKSHTNER